MEQEGIVKSTVVIPNYNGISYIKDCLDSLLADKAEHDFSIVVVDNHSTDGSRELIRNEYPQVELICFEENTGFCRAVNAGIEAAKTEFVILLNNDTTAEEGFVSALEEAMERYPKAFSVGAKLVDMKNPAIVDDAGDFYCALGWAFARGTGKMADKFVKETKVFSACAGAAIYRKNVFEEIGFFDELHFAYLEDLDIGYRAKIYGYQNYFTPEAVVHHAGSASSGSRHNAFKVDLSSKNSVYVIYKNMPLLQQIINLPFFILGYFVKWLFFLRKGLGKNYASGVFGGIKRNWTKEAKKRKIRFKMSHLGNYILIQLELWKNLVLRLYY